jgi:hypothetical protein
MIGKAARLATYSRNHEDVRISVVVSGVGDPLSIWRKVRVKLGSDTGGETLGITPFAADGPNIAGIAERDLIVANRWVTNQKRFGGICPTCHRKRDEAKLKSKCACHDVPRDLGQQGNCALPQNDHAFLQHDAKGHYSVLQNVIALSDW